MPRNRRRTAGNAAIRGIVVITLAIAAFVAVSIVGFHLAGARAADVKVDCTLTVPSEPLSARGLATPYELSGSGCSETDSAASAFVQASVIDTRTGKLSNYTPLVVTAGTRPAAATVLPKLPAHRVVGIWFGFNGDNLTLRSRHNGLQSGSCVNGVAGSVFGHSAYCNAPAFFTAANTAIRSGRLAVPALGTGKDGEACPTARDFGVVDQDQGDTVTTAYYAHDGRTAQATTPNATRLKSGVTLTNGSDSGLVDRVLDPVLGCSPWTAPDLTNGGAPSTSLALDELQAAAKQVAPAALVPLNHRMTLADGKHNAAKTNAYRAGVDMGSLATAPGQTPAQYCTDLTAAGWTRMQLSKAAFLATASPDTRAANNLYTFLGARLAGSYDALGCKALLHHANPLRVTTQNGVAVAMGTSAAGVADQAPTVAPTRAAPTTAAPTPTPAGTAAAAKGSPKPKSTPTPTASTPTPTASTTTPAATAAGAYPWHTNIVSTTFWVGEIFDPNAADGSQVLSTYDSTWMQDFGGCDGQVVGNGCNTEARTASNGYFPVHMTPKENPFYLDLPYDDVNDATAYAERGTVIPWASQPAYAAKVRDPNSSLMKNRWVELRKDGHVCYGQIEDAGPGQYHDAKYVFGSDDARPANARFGGAGLDVSPALNGCLGFAELNGDTDKVDWRFVDGGDVPTGPWNRIATASGVHE